LSVDEDCAVEKDIIEKRMVGSEPISRRLSTIQRTGQRTEGVIP
jgi:hypothetical protein